MRFLSEESVDARKPILMHAPSNVFHTAALKDAGDNETDIALGLQVGATMLRKQPCELLWDRHIRKLSQ